MIRSLKFFKLYHLLYGNNPKPELKKFEELGLLAVKIGQMYALRADFLSPEKCQHLSKLYRLNTPIKKEVIKDRFEKRAPKALLKDLESFEDQALATASVGQVHAAKLKNGEKIVIKITKADFKKDFLADVRAFKRLFKWMIFFKPKLAQVADPLGTLATVEHSTLAELDLRKEIEGQKTLKKVQNGHTKIDLKNLAFPKIYEAYSNKDILVMEHIEAPTFDELMNQNKLTYKDALKLFKVHGAMMFLAWKFHGDLHPGNIFLKNEKLCFIDISTIEEIDPELGRGLLKFFLAMSNNDFKGCAKELHKMSQKKLSPKKYERFEKKMLDLYKDFGGKSVSEVSLTNQMMKTVKLAVYSGIEFPKGIFAIIKSLMYLDGMVMKAAPETVLSDMIKDLGVYSNQFLEK